MSIPRVFCYLGRHPISHPYTPYLTFMGMIWVSFRKYWWSYIETLLFISGHHTFNRLCICCLKYANSFIIIFWNIEYKQQPRCEWALRFWLKKVMNCKTCTDGNQCDNHQNYFGSNIYCVHKILLKLISIWNYKCIVKYGIHYPVDHFGIYKLNCVHRSKKVGDDLLHWPHLARQSAGSIYSFHWWTDKHPNIDKIARQRNQNIWNTNNP